MKNLKCVVAYSGTNYFGFQKTKMGPSIEEEMQKVLEQILQHPIALQVASRTDRGVHAKGQACNFFTEKEVDLEKLHASLRSLLPPSISPLKLEIMPDAFHPTLHAKAKEYHYFLCNQRTQLYFHREYSWHVPIPLDLNLMQKGAKLLEGRRDFSAFSNARSTKPICFVEKIAVIPLLENRIQIIVIGDRFLYKMARNIMGLLVSVGLKKMSLSKLPSIFEKKDRRLASVTAPPHGLCLEKIFY